MMNATDRTAHRHANELWGVTCYFNPSGYRRRLANYRVFRENLPVALVAIELAYGPSFELSAGDADILVQLRSGDVMWQKERLLNLTLRTLPSSCRKIAWLDCDVIFAADDWAQRTALLLDHFALVQPFARVHRMPEHWVLGQPLPPEAELRRSVPLLVAEGMSAATCLETSARQIGCLHGHAWAANRELLEAHHFYDACILGGGDSAMLCAAYGCFDTAMHLLSMGSRHKEHYLA